MCNIDSGTGVTGSTSLLTGGTMAGTLPNTSDLVSNMCSTRWQAQRIGGGSDSGRMDLEAHINSQGQPLDHPSMRPMILLGSNILLIGSPMILAEV